MKTLITTLGILALVTGCGDKDSDSGGHDHHDHDSMDTLPDDFDAATELATENGSYMVSYTTDPSPIPENDYFTVTVSVHDAAGTALVADAEAIVDAKMPAHGHGMNTQPEVTANGDGTFLAEGMLFHMPGYWQITVDVTGPEGVDSVAFEVDCCE